MSTTDTRFSALIEQFTGSLQSPDEDVRRKATDDLYERIIAQYADVSSVMISREKKQFETKQKTDFQAPTDVVTSIAEQIQEFVRKKLSNANEINENRAALLVIRMFLFFFVYLSINYIGNFLLLLFQFVLFVLVKIFTLN